MPDQSISLFAATHSIRRTPGLVLITGCLLNCVAVAQQPAAIAKRPVPIVFDTDITGDVDDVLALAMLHALADRGECSIQAVTVSKIHPLAAPFVDAVNTFYGRPDIPIGATRDAQRRDSRYLKLIEERDHGNLRYPYDLRPQAVPTAVSVLRRTLAAAEDRSLVLIQVGLAANLADLVESPADEISPLSGRELVEQKVKLASVMAGAFRPVRGDQHFLEANVRNGISSMQRFADQWPTSVPVIWSDFLIGISAPYPRQSIAREFEYVEHHIVKEAYLLHSGPNHDRPTWDLTSVLQAVRPNDGYFDLSEAGRVTVEADGYTRFTRDRNGRDRYLLMNEQQAARVIEVQRALVSQPPFHVRARPTEAP